jgi:hypothetical protein
VFDRTASRRSRLGLRQTPERVSEPRVNSGFRAFDCPNLSRLFHRPCRCTLTLGHGVCRVPQAHEGSRKLPKISGTQLAAASRPWQLAFQPGRGAPESVTLDSLLPGAKAATCAKYFSGTAAYTNSIQAPPEWRKRRNGTLDRLEPIGRRMGMPIGETPALLTRAVAYEKHGVTPGGVISP